MCWRASGTFGRLAFATLVFAVSCSSADAPHDAEPPNAPAWGYDERPANETCKAPARPTGAANDPFPQTLSATGCMSRDDVTQPAAGLIPYAVNAPLWSDAAGKGRWMALPPGQTIAIEADGDWTMPIGTVLLKSFELGGELVETRLLVRHADGDWAGYSYRWRADHREADLLDAETIKSVGEAPAANDEWTFPSRMQCLQCHTTAAGRSLGLETAQLNGTMLYPNGRRANQIATLDHIGAFAASPGDPAKLPAFPVPTDARAGSVTARARAYLHANCSNCHRPGGVTEVGIDLRATTALASMGVCNVKPNKNNYGYTEASLITPGDPLASILSIRINTAIRSVRMPQIASSVVDREGAAVVDAWITSLQSCP